MKTKETLSGGSDLRVVLVEDNDRMRKLLRTLLKAMGIRTLFEFREGAAALEQLESTRPDFILTDLSMASMDGIHFTRAIRRLPDEVTCVTPIIMVTGHTERHRIEAARDAGVNEILAKPITIAGLFNRIEQIVHRPRPFVRSANYIGPCRRRRRDPRYTGPWRRKTDTPESVGAEFASASDGAGLP